MKLEKELRYKFNHILYKDYNSCFIALVKFKQNLWKQVIKSYPNDTTKQQQSLFATLTENLKIVSVE